MWRPVASVSSPQPRLGADEGKNHLNSASQHRGRPSRSRRRLYRQHRPKADIRKLMIGIARYLDERVTREFA
jgi:hypothetical protein